MDDGIVHSALRLLLQSGQGLGILVAHIPVDGQRWRPVDGFGGHRAELEYRRPAEVTATMVGIGGIRFQVPKRHLIGVKDEFFSLISLNRFYNGSIVWLNIVRSNAILEYS